ncbi:MAG: type II toxin-antitoxin system VapC family toxin [Marinoscillum sp.]
MLWDSNIIIYSAKPKYSFLLDLLENQDIKVSVISKIEVFGYGLLDVSDHEYFSLMFSQIDVLSVSPAVVDLSIEVKKLKKISLGDAIIASNALDHGQTLVTRNTKDFEHIDGLSLLNPF